MRHEWNCSLPSASHCWWPFSSNISHLHSRPQSVALLGCSLDTSPCASSTTVLLGFSWGYTVRSRMLSLFLYLFFFVYYLCEKYYKPTAVENNVSDCVSLLDLKANWTYKRALGMECVWTYCAKIEMIVSRILIFLDIQHFFPQRFSHNLGFFSCKLHIYILYQYFSW